MHLKQSRMTCHIPIDYSTIFKSSLTMVIMSGIQVELLANVNKAQSKPNFIIMFVDDLGYNDIGIRNPSFQTPNIDKLAVSSFNFENAYVASPTSSPSRVGLLTGRHPMKVGFTRHVDKESRDLYGNGEWTVLDTDPGRRPNRSFLPLSEITLAEVLKEAGYTTYHIGKWHLGPREYYPDKQGFDFMFGESNAGLPVNYFPPYFQRKKTQNEGVYLNDYLTNKAVDWISNHDYNQSPLMMYFAHYAVHSPFIAQHEKVDKYIARGMERSYAIYHAMVESMDESVGKVLQAMEDAQIADNTVFIFISDQGGYFTNAPLRGGKMEGQHYDGGAKVPFFIRYKDSGAATVQQRISTLDVFPTIIEMAGGKPKEHRQLDGLSLFPLLNGGKRKQQPIYIYRSYDDTPASLILGDKKYIVSRSGKDEFYNLKNDPGEQNNLINNSADAKGVKKIKQMIYSYLKRYEMPEVK